MVPVEEESDRRRDGGDRQLFGRLYLLATSLVVLERSIFVERERENEQATLACSNGLGPLKTFHFKELFVIFYHNNFVRRQKRNYLAKN